MALVISKVLSLIANKVRKVGWKGEVGSHRVKMTVLTLICISETSYQSMTKIKSYLTFMKIYLLMKKMAFKGQESHDEEKQTPSNSNKLEF